MYNDDIYVVDCTFVSLFLVVVFTTAWSRGSKEETSHCDISEMRNRRCFSIKSIYYCLSDVALSVSSAEAISGRPKLITTWKQQWNDVWMNRTQTSMDRGYRNSPMVR